MRCGRMALQEGRWQYCLINCRWPASCILYEKTHCCKQGHEGACCWRWLLLVSPCQLRMQSSSTKTAPHALNSCMKGADQFELTMPPCIACTKPRDCWCRDSAVKYPGTVTVHAHCISRSATARCHQAVIELHYGTPDLQVYPRYSLPPGDTAHFHSICFSGCCCWCTKGFNSCAATQDRRAAMREGLVTRPPMLAT